MLPFGVFIVVFAAVALLRKDANWKDRLHRAAISAMGAALASVIILLIAQNTLT